MEFKFEYTLSDQDFRAAAKLLAKRQHLKTWSTLASMALILIALYLLPSESGTLFVVGAVTGAFGMSLCGVLSYRSQLAKNYKSIPSMVETNFLTITRENITQVASTWETRYAWSHFQSFVETESHFFLLLGAYPGLWFPKRVLSEPDQENLRIVLKERFLKL